ncbi:MAG: exonuclease domain-containing protein [Eggerthellaceae bacterium]|jgi:DNA polymerase III epsilon subunit-like protein
MNVNQALEHANTLFIPELMFGFGDEALAAERDKNEEAIKVLSEAWFAQEKDPFSFDIVRDLVDRNRKLCDAMTPGAFDSRDPNLSHALSDEDVKNGIAKMQHRRPATIAKELEKAHGNMGVVYSSKPVKGTVVGIDLETTGTHPSREYIINVGWEIMDLTSTAQPHDAFSFLNGLPEKYQAGIPAEEIHHITYDMVADKIPFREDDELQKNLLAVLTAHPFMAHNAAFEDAWLTLNLKGYAEGRKAGKITPIDTRDICRSLDPEAKSLPWDQSPATLENWARRRGTLDADEGEKHLGLEDADLMLRTVQAEFIKRELFAE